MARRYPHGDPRRRLYVAKVDSDNARKFLPYVVSLYDGRWECDCKAWTMTMPRRDCEDIRCVRDALARTLHSEGAYVEIASRTRGVHFGFEFLRFISRNLIETRTERGNAALALLDLITEGGEGAASGAWNMLMELITDDSRQAEST